MVIFHSYVNGYQRVNNGVAVNIAFVQRNKQDGTLATVGW